MNLFGTDGVRTKANTYPLTPQAIIQIAMAIYSHFKKKINLSHTLTVLIGKDTRSSGYMIETALQSGFVAMGANVVLLGPIPTPAVAYLTRSMRADIGVMISASHNPYDDNGIKFFDSMGLKLTTSEEKEVESYFHQLLPLPSPDHMGKAKRLDDGAFRYLEFVKTVFPKGLRLDGLKIVLDCANGASYKIAPLLLWELGAEVISIGIHPNGFNINQNCGATSLQALRCAVLEHSAQFGIALDGDSDRLMMVDENGAVVDGDFLMGFVAKQLREQNQLKGGGIVGTVMSNLGLEHYLKDLNLKLYRSSVGDKHVIDLMIKNGCNIGGEPSGHLIFSDYLTTGDGLLAALQILGILIKKGYPASHLHSIFQKVPHVLKNFPLASCVLEKQEVVEFIALQKKRLPEGRILVRASGTEKLIRVMVEDSSSDLVRDVMGSLEDFLITQAQEIPQEV